MERIRQGHCTVFNPFNRHQVSRVSLLPEDVEVIVFWSKNPRPLFVYLDELDQRGYQYYFHFTLNGYPSVLEPQVPEREASIETFTELAERLGPGRVIWRYDPIILSNITGYEYHQEQFQRIAKSLQGSTRRVMVSIVDPYRKAVTNFKQLAQQEIFVKDQFSQPEFNNLMRALANTAKQNGMEIFSCAENIDLRPYGISPGKCIDSQYIKRVFNQAVAAIKDKSQRSACGCVPSKDIGAYDTCLHGCAYCYAGTLKSGRKNREQHNWNASSLIGNSRLLTPE